MIKKSCSLPASAYRGVTPCVIEDFVANTGRTIRSITVSPTVNCYTTEQKAEDMVIFRTVEPDYSKTMLRRIFSRICPQSDSRFAGHPSSMMYRFSARTMCTPNVVQPWPESEVSLVMVVGSPSTVVWLTFCTSPHLRSLVETRRSIRSAVTSLKS